MQRGKGPRGPWIEECPADCARDWSRHQLCAWASCCSWSRPVWWCHLLSLGCCRLWCHSALFPASTQDTRTHRSDQLPDTTHENCAGKAKRHHTLHGVADWDALYHCVWHAITLDKLYHLLMLSHRRTLWFAYAMLSHKTHSITLLMLWGETNSLTCLCYHIETHSITCLCFHIDALYHLLMLCYHIETHSITCLCYQIGTLYHLLMLRYHTRRTLSLAYAMGWDEAYHLLMLSHRNQVYHWLMLSHWRTLSLAYAMLSHETHSITCLYYHIDALYNLLMLSHHLPTHCVLWGGYGY